MKTCEKSPQKLFFRSHRLLKQIVMNTSNQFPKDILKESTQRKLRFGLNCPLDNTENFTTLEETKNNEGMEEKHF